jgi:hypothetical protein
MWTKSHSIVTKTVTKEQLWSLLSDVNNWHTWDESIDFAKMEGAFEKGNHFLLKPKGGPKVNIELIEVNKPFKFVDMTKFPLAKMYGEHTFEDTADGLKLTTTMKVEGVLGFLWRKLVAQGIVDALPSEMENQIKLASTL